MARNVRNDSILQGSMSAPLRISQGREVFGHGHVRRIVTSGDFVFHPNINRYRVTVVGAGGCGGQLLSTQEGFATGGGGGGCIQVIYTKPAATTKIFLGIGQGGGHLTFSDNSDGGAGSATSFGNKVSIAGGKGGKFSSDFSNCLGGEGSDVGYFDPTTCEVTLNLPGARGGNVSGFADKTGLHIYTGGGAGFGGARGGDARIIEADPWSGNTTRISTGGGGMGGNGGDFISELLTTPAEVATGGGGTGGPAEPVNRTSQFKPGCNISGSYDNSAFPIGPDVSRHELDGRFTGSGGSYLLIGASPERGGLGGGGGGGMSTGNAGNSLAGGGCGGSGGLAYTTGLYNPNYISGGGGGGICTLDVNGNTTTATYGGSGLIILEW